MLGLDELKQFMARLERPAMDVALILKAILNRYPDFSIASGFHNAADAVG
jgi:hypothetical protein